MHLKRSYRLPKGYVFASGILHPDVTVVADLNAIHVTMSEIFL
jgi:hypothetical protein